MSRRLTPQERIARAIESGAHPPALAQAAISAWIAFRIAHMEDGASLPEAIATEIKTVSVEITRALNRDPQEAADLAIAGVSGPLEEAARDRIVALQAADQACAGLSPTRRDPIDLADALALVFGEVPPCV